LLTSFGLYYHNVNVMFAHCRFYDIRMAQTVSAVTPSCISRVCSRSHEHHKPFWSSWYSPTSNGGTKGRKNLDNLVKSSMYLLGKVLVHFVAQLASFGTNFELRMMQSSNLFMLIFQSLEVSQVQGDWALVRTEQSPKFPSTSALRQVFVMYVNCFLFDSSHTVLHHCRKGDWQFHLQTMMLFCSNCAQ
jgi:hypothetical protein